MICGKFIHDIGLLMLKDSCKPTVSELFIIIKVQEYQHQLVLVIIEEKLENGQKKTKTEQFLMQIIKLVPKLVMMNLLQRK